MQTRSDSNFKEVVSSARTKGDKAIDPPKDLWELLDAEVAQRMRVAPEGSISTTDVMDKYKVDDRAARRILAKLVREDKLVFVGSFGSMRKKYYAPKR